MTTYKLPVVRPHRRHSRSTYLTIIAGLFVAMILPFGAQAAVAVDELAWLITLDIPANTSLEDALIQLGREAGLTVMIDARSVTGRLTNEMRGTFNTSDALNILLHNSGLAYTKQGNIVHIIRTDGTGWLRKSRAEVGEMPLASSDFNLDSGRIEGSDGSPSDSEGDSQLEQVLVTAQKTGVAERLQDVPVPISVISAQALMETNRGQLEDYFDQIPGLMVSQGGNVASIVSIRGITTGQNSNPTVGFTLDDVPLGGSTNTGAFSQVPFINPADLAQVEVLRGPQGTLYGDNSMGGLIRYVTVDPSTDRISGDVRVGGDEVVNGTHLGYNTSAAINVPLTDALAIRISAFSRLDPGYIDDVETGARGINTTTASGGRIALMWTPLPDFSLKFNELYEKSDQHAGTGIDVPTAGYPQTAELSGLEQYTAQGIGAYDQVWKITSLTLNANLSGIKVTSISGYTINGFDTNQDATYAVTTPPSLAAPLAAPLEYTNSLHKFSQEVRLSSAVGSYLDWLLGGFYTQEDSTGANIWSQTNPTTGILVGVPGSLFYSGGPSRFREYAGFGALTWKVNEQFDVQFGARESYLGNPFYDKGDYSGGTLLGLSPGPSVYNPPADSYYHTKAFTYLVSPRFKISSDTMVYARVSDGFRPGGGVSNPAPTSSCVELHQPCQINSDKITNFEVGAKADFFSHSFSIDSSAYYIDWKDLQVTLMSGVLDYAANGAGAKSQGVDLSLEWKPLDGLKISTWGAWDEAATTQPFANATTGQRLPFSPRFSGNFSARQDVPITGNIYAFAEAKEIYVGNRIGNFTRISSPRQYYPAYSQTDVDAGLHAEPWTFNVYVNNATDRRGELYGGLGGTPFEFNYINPRTIGLSVDRTF